MPRFGVNMKWFWHLWAMYLVLWYQGEWKARQCHSLGTVWQCQSKLPANAISLDWRDVLGCHRNETPGRERMAWVLGSLPRLPHLWPHRLFPSKPAKEVKDSEIFPLLFFCEGDKRNCILFILCNCFFNKIWSILCLNINPWLPLPETLIQ